MPPPGLGVAHGVEGVVLRQLVVVCVGEGDQVPLLGTHRKQGLQERGVHQTLALAAGGGRGAGITALHSVWGDTQ